MKINKPTIAAVAFALGIGAAEIYEASDTEPYYPIKDKHYSVKTGPANQSPAEKAALEHLSKEDLGELECRELTSHPWLNRVNSDELEEKRVKIRMIVDCRPSSGDDKECGGDVYFDEDGNIITASLC